MENSPEQQRSAAIALLESWVEKCLSPEDYGWLSQRISQSLQSNSGKDLYMTLGLIPRKLSKQDLALSSNDLSQAMQARSGWDPSAWTIAGAARILVLARVASAQEESFETLYSELCRTADVTESIELYSALPLLPTGTKLDTQIAEGLRSNMKAVFEAIAHRNPYPRETFDENRWNHMVLKALFVDSTLAPIQGLDERANDELAGILCDYAHERWAANRPVTCELWRCVGPFATGSRLDDLARVLAGDDVAGQQAAAIALSQSPDPQAETLLHNKTPELAEAAKQGMLTWQANNTKPVYLEPVH